MFAKKICSVLIAGVMLFASLSVQAKNYRRLLNRHYQKAETSAEAIRPLLQKYARLYNENPRLLEAVVFPELMRYNAVFNVIETGSLMSLYTRLGSDYADFSIGRFQMKPSFALSVENYVLQNTDKPWARALKFDEISTEDTYEARSARIDRLSDVEWQVKYLIAVFKCIKQKHAAYLNKISLRQQIVFIATAYNCGWDKSTATINCFTTKCYYCISPWQTGRKYNFADIALQRFAELKYPNKAIAYTAA
ncbi:hypothetical protein ACFQZX_16260 [Mucilaginibacter litoreus]|uniref:Transglycosylase SLT domain-containing protein n=1 Tax=Mucilaginibacter litoreus TaxID=1048221 RepID=A0ABW3AWB6_9SPHI